VYSEHDDGIENDGYVTDERAEELANDAFILGAQMCREMMARFIEQGGDARSAASIRANWNSSWGEDPGTPLKVDYDLTFSGFDAWGQL
jgi:hypothetical protein